MAINAHVRVSELKLGTKANSQQLTAKTPVIALKETDD